MRAAAGEALLLAAHAGVSYGEQNLGADTPLTRMQLWLDACPERSNERIQRLTLQPQPHQLLASPDGAQGSLHLRQQVWVHHLDLPPGETLTLPLQRRARLPAVNPRRLLRPRRASCAAAPDLRRRRFCA
ncbi:hypothetical protein GGER_46600 [Serratia rubidaea]